MCAVAMSDERKSKRPEGVERVYTVDEAAAILGFHPNTIRQMLRDGEIAGFKVGRRRWRINEHTLNGLRHAQDGDKQQ